MAAAEAGADYVMFGEPDNGERPAFAAIEERVAWWAEVFEAPCVAFAAGPDEVTPLVTAGADFIALGASFNDWSGAIRKPSRRRSPMPPAACTCRRPRHDARRPRRGFDPGGGVERLVRAGAAQNAAGST